MEREYDRDKDSKKALKEVHTTIREWLREASEHLDNKNYINLEYIYFQIEQIASSVGESARVLQLQRLEEETK